MPSKLFRIFDDEYKAVDIKEALRRTYGDSLIKVQEVKEDPTTIKITDEGNPRVELKEDEVDEKVIRGIQKRIDEINNPHNDPDCPIEKLPEYECMAIVVWNHRNKLNEIIDRLNKE